MLDSGLGPCVSASQRPRVEVLDASMLNHMQDISRHITPLRECDNIFTMQLIDSCLSCSWTTRLLYNESRRINYPHIRSNCDS